MIIGSPEFLQKSIKWYGYYRLIGVVAPFVSITVLFLFFPTVQAVVVFFIGCAVLFVSGLLVAFGGVLYAVVYTLLGSPKYVPKHSRKVQSA